MWFKRKPENRRLERRQVLDVKLRPDRARAVRHRALAMGLGVLLTTMLGAAVLWVGGEWLLNRLVYQNKAFAIQELDIRTDGAIAVDQLKRWTGVRLHDNLLALDLAQVKRDLEFNPLVESVSVERILPRTLRIRVREREPVAQIKVPRPGPGGGLELGVFLIDARGYVMSPLAPHQRAPGTTADDDQLPVLGGLNSTEARPGRRIELPQVQAALQLVLAFQYSPLAGVVDLKRIDVCSPDVLGVTTSQGSEITLATTDIDQQLRRWREIYDYAQKLNLSVATLDLAVSNNVPARWLEAAAAPLSTAKPPKPQHPRKKHV